MTDIGKKIEGLAEQVKDTATSLVDETRKQAKEAFERIKAARELAAKRLDEAKHKAVELRTSP